MIWELKSGSVPRILWGHCVGAIQIIMVLLMAVCSTLILNHELLYGAVDTVFLVHFLRQMQILYLHSYLGRSQVGFPVQTVSSKYEPSGTISFASTRRLFKLLKRQLKENSDMGWVVYVYKRFHRDLRHFQPTWNSRHPGWDEPEEGLLLDPEKFSIFYFIKQDEGRAFH